jgi:hypothetical protein
VDRVGGRATYPSTKVHPRPLAKGVGCDLPTAPLPVGFGSSPVETNWRGAGPLYVEGKIVFSYFIG